MIVFIFSGCQSGPYVFVGESESWKAKLNSGGEKTDHVEVVLSYKRPNAYPNDLVRYVINGENMEIDMEGEGVNEDGTLRFGIFDITSEFRLKKAEEIASTVIWENKKEEIILNKQ